MPLPLPPAYRATRADKEKDKKEGFVESKGAVADPLPLPLPLPPRLSYLRLRKGAKDKKEGFVESKG